MVKMRKSGEDEKVKGTQKGGGGGGGGEGKRCKLEWLCRTFSRVIGSSFSG